MTKETGRSKFHFMSVEALNALMQTDEKTAVFLGAKWDTSKEFKTFAVNRVGATIGQYIVFDSPTLYGIIKRLDRLNYSYILHTKSKKVNTFVTAAEPNYQGSHIAIDTEMLHEDEDETTGFSITVEAGVFSVADLAGDFWLERLGNVAIKPIDRETANKHFFAFYGNFAESYAEALDAIKPPNTATDF